MSSFRRMVYFAIAVASGYFAYRLGAESASRYSDYLLINLGQVNNLDLWSMELIFVLLGFMAVVCAAISLCLLCVVFRLDSGSK